MSKQPLSTGCGPLDDLLGGGVPRKTVTQLYGPPAAGKTNIALSAAVEAGGNGGSSLYIDTEGVSADRFEQLLAAQTDDVDSVAARVLFETAFDFEEQKAAVEAATEVGPDVELVVLDSATGFYRLERGTDVSEGDTLRAVTNQVTHLLSLARKHDIAVVITNQVFTDPETDRVRALGGNTLEHWTGVILRVDRYRGGNRRATLEKHQSRAAGETAQFKITDSGLEGSASQ